MLLGVWARCQSNRLRTVCVGPPSESPSRHPPVCRKLAFAAGLEVPFRFSTSQTRELRAKRCGHSRTRAPASGGGGCRCRLVKLLLSRAAVVYGLPVVLRQRCAPARYSQGSVYSQLQHCVSHAAIDRLRSTLADAWPPRRERSRFRSRSNRPHLPDQAHAFPPSIMVWSSRMIAYTSLCASARRTQLFRSRASNIRLALVCEFALPGDRKCTSN